MVKIQLASPYDGNEYVEVTIGNQAFLFSRLENGKLGFGDQYGRDLYFDELTSQGRAMLHKTINQAIEVYHKKLKSQDDQLSADRAQQCAQELAQMLAQNRGLDSPLNSDRRIYGL